MAGMCATWNSVDLDVQSMAVIGVCDGSALLVAAAVVQTLEAVVDAGGLGDSMIRWRATLALEARGQLRAIFC
jgi:hypothetical protein